MTTFVFNVRNVPAALYKALGGFATNGINMTKLESYMVGGQFTATQFYADVEAHPDDRPLQAGARGTRILLDRGPDPRRLPGPPAAHRRAPAGTRRRLMPTVEADKLTGIARRVFAAAGSAEEEAAIVAEHLVEANLKGHDSHGVGMIPSYLRNLRGGNAKTNEPGRVVSDQGSIIVYDGERGWGQIVARNATLLGIERAKRDGVAVVALAQRAPYRPDRHLWRDVRRRRPGVDAFRQHHRPAPGGGAVARPRRAVRHQPVLRRPARPGARAADHRRHGDEPHRDGQGAGGAQQGRADRRRHPARPGRRADRPIPNVMYRRPRGALLTFGEHKGYALAFICEMLAGAVTGSGTMRPERQDAESVTNGMLTIVIDPGRLADRAWMSDEIRAMADYITASPPRRPDEPVLIPGDPERANRAERLQDGVPIDDETWREIVEAARGVNVLAEA